MLYLRVLIFTLVLANTCAVLAGGEHTTGTLIVHYSTGVKSERLNRVRFWLKNGEGKQTLYPKGGNFFDDTSEKTRLVVIENLPASTYTVSFLIPNRDRLFEEIPLRTVSIVGGEVTKVVQRIRPRYASLKALVKPVAEEKRFETPPVIYLKDRLGHVHIKATKGKLSAQELIPGEYTVDFADLEGYQTPDSVEITLDPDEVAGPYVGKYKPIVGVESFSD